jgi:threonine dehydrogenase-like Zn-dependent dehydrogenase
MKALVYTDKETLVYREEPLPLINKQSALVKVSACGICGSDMHAYHGKDSRREAPLVFGHEVTGVVEEGSLKGKKVILNPLITCGECSFCKLGKEHLCSKRTMIGMKIPIERSGGFAEYVSIPEKNIFELPQELDIKLASLSEPAAVAYHAFQIAKESYFKPLDQSKILIMGGGAIGLLCGLMLTKVEKCEDVTITDINAKRLEQCKRSCSAKTLIADDPAIKENSYDIVIDCVGFEITRKKSIHIIQPGGLIIHIGLSEDAGSFDFRKMTLQEVNIIGTYCYTNKDFKETINILKDKKIGDLSWVEFRPLRDGAQAFKEIHDGTCIAPKIVLIP